MYEVAALGGKKHQELSCGNIKFDMLSRYSERVSSRQLSMGDQSSVEKSRWIKPGGH